MTRKHRRTGQKPSGRPHKPIADDPDITTIANADALRRLLQIGEREAFDLAIALREGWPIEPKPGSQAAFEISAMNSFRNRSAVLRAKAKRLPPTIRWQASLAAAARLLRGPKK